MLTIEDKEILYDIYYKYIKNNLSKVIKKGKGNIIIFYSIKTVFDPPINGQIIGLEIKHVISSSITFKQDIRDIIFRPDFFEFWFLPPELKEVIGFENKGIIALRKNK